MLYTDIESGKMQDAERNQRKDEFPLKKMLKLGVGNQGRQPGVQRGATQTSEELLCG